MGAGWRGRNERGRGHELRAHGLPCNFRVHRPVDAARVRILAGGEELFAGKVRPFKPSVMENFPLPAKVIQRALDLGASEIVLSVDPVEEA